MLCEECKKNQATVSITVTTGDETTTRHLCPECMQRMELSLAHGDIQSFLSSILSILSSQKSEPSLTCSVCGLSYDEFERTGKLGCAQCYRDFAEQLKPLLQRIHGRTQHAGRKPANQPAPSAELAGNQLEQHMEELRQKMDEAVASENFEDAAKYRDELRALVPHGEEKQA
ncbi:MAG: UvrB/UvrC motif-containing protein [Clostridia bacterium]